MLMSLRLKVCMVVQLATCCDIFYYMLYMAIYGYIWLYMAIYSPLHL